VKINPCRKKRSPFLGSKGEDKKKHILTLKKEKKKYLKQWYFFCFLAENLPKMEFKSSSRRFRKLKTKINKNVLHSDGTFNQVFFFVFF
jgi:hypothetical protein